MENKKNDTLKSLIQNVELDKPAPHFTVLVMEEVESAVRNEIVINSSLKSILKVNGVEKPSSDFTRHVMVQVKSLDTKTTVKPIISKNAWRTMGGVAVGLFIFLSFSDVNSPQGLTPHFINFGKVLTSIFANVPSLYLITLISISILLLVDYSLKNKAQSHGRKSHTFM